ncbi:head GIN domain-containing protein [Paraflavitalea sp. CAU 1676]|uniref:head GIN domain-containing protein n=1 Tax=Paraflavitalea sp. CAU 1676 TaxID=3032598 RepID=UPI0023DA9ACB|nr:head GIN domain-containing protein [Paraflavitalea sp. CAU 1676]MDF2191118.1 DUF2807 domain-containing protein [Paraflavitalea sp. CAU 1676]
MKRSILVLSVLSMFLLTVSCKKKLVGEGPSVTETRVVTNFTKVSMGLPGIMYVTQEPGYKLTIDAQQNILDNIRSVVSGGELKLYFDWDKRIGKHDKVIVRVSAPLYDRLNLSGSGDISSSKPIDADVLDLTISGSGSIMLADADVSGILHAAVSGSGTIQVNSGVAKTGNFEVSGSGNMEMLGVGFEKVEAHISGSGNIKATVSQELKAHISGSGSVYYKGSPVVESHVSGSGSVKKVQ